VKSRKPFPVGHEQSQPDDLRAKRYLEFTDEACSENGRVAEEFVRDDGILSTCLVITADGEQ
jgi:hypothetical protein